MWGVRGGWGPRPTAGAEHVRQSLVRLAEVRGLGRLEELARAVQERLDPPLVGGLGLERAAKLAAAAVDGVAGEALVADLAVDEPLVEQRSLSRRGVGVAVDAHRAQVDRVGPAHARLVDDVRRAREDGVRSGRAGEARICGPLAVPWVVGVEPEGAA